jgi:hypothetical protein
MKARSLVLGMLLAFLTVGAQATPPPPIPAGFDIYREPITSAHHLDWLWRDYLINGQLRAIEKITTALKLSEYSGALKKAKEIRTSRPLTQKEKQAALFDAIFSAAMWSLESNAKQHSAVLAELIRIESANRNGQDASHPYLLLILTKAQPDQFKIIDKTNGLTFLTPTGKVRVTAGRPPSLQ